MSLRTLQRTLLARLRTLPRTQAERTLPPGPKWGFRAPPPPSPAAGPRRGATAVEVKDY